MRVTRAQAEENRDRVVDVAGALFRSKGFENVSIADIMRDADLTHGGFYNSFASKDALAEEACARLLDGASEGWARIAAASPDAALQKIVADYLSKRHRDSPQTGCPFAALAADAARRDRPIRAAFTKGLQPMVDLLTRMLPGREKARRRKHALAAVSMLVGTMILARAVDDAKLSDELLKASSSILAKPPFAGLS